MVTVDRLTSFTVLTVLSVHASAHKMANRFFEEVIAIFGLPLKITSDNDVLFGARFWRSLMDKAGIEHLTTAVCRPQANGKAERRIRVVKEALKAAKEAAPTDNWDWKTAVKAVQFA